MAGSRRGGGRDRPEERSLAQELADACLSGFKGHGTFHRRGSLSAAERKTGGRGWPQSELKLPCSGPTPTKLSGQRARKSDGSESSSHKSSSSRTTGSPQTAPTVNAPNATTGVVALPFWAETSTFGHGKVGCRKNVTVPVSGGAPAVASTVR